MHIFIEIYVTISVATIHLISLVIENPSAWYDIVGSLWVRLWRSSLSYIIFDPCLPGQTHFADETKLIIMQSTWSTKLNGMWSDDNVVMLNINIALMIFSHNMPLLPGTSDFCSSAAWRNLTHQQGCFFPIFLPSSFNALIDFANTVHCVSSFNIFCHFCIVEDTPKNVWPAFGYQQEPM